MNNLLSVRNTNCMVGHSRSDAIAGIMTFSGAEAGNYMRFMDGNQRCRYLYALLIEIQVSINVSVSVSNLGLATIAFLIVINHKSCAAINHDSTIMSIAHTLQEREITIKSRYM